MHLSVMHLKDADRMANSVDADQEQSDLGLLFAKTSLSNIMVVTDSLIYL